MRQKALAFTKTTVLNLRKTMQKYERTSHYTEATNSMLANQHAKDATNLELWEAMLEMLECSVSQCSQCGRKA